MEINLTRNNLVCSLLKRLRFLIVELLFVIFFQQCRIFSSILGFQYELLPYLAQKFRHSGRKCILRVQVKVWRKIGFRLQSVKVFKSIWTLHKSLSDFSWKSAARSSGLHSTCTRARFEKMTIVSRKHVSLIVMGLRVERKKNWLLTMFRPHCCRNFILSLQIWFFVEHFFSSYVFWDPSKRCWDFLRTNFGTFVEAAFHVYRQTIWGETIFSNEYSSSCLFVTWRGKYFA